MKNYGALCKKISSRRGAAMLIALLVILIAVLSGTVALTMAASNAGRYTHEKDDQQAYLSVASAGKLILNKLESVVVEYKSTGQSYPESANEIDINYYGSDYAPGTSTPIPTNNAGLFLSDSRFQNMLKTFSLSNAPGTVTAMETISFVLTVPAAAEMGKVYVSIDLSGAEFSFRLYSMRGESRDYQITMCVLSTFDRDGTNNFIQRDDKYFYRAMTFNTQNATFEVERLTGEAE